MRRLVDAGLLEARAVVDGEVVLRNVSRSNAVFLVDGGSRALVVKAGVEDRVGDHGDAHAEEVVYRAASTAEVRLPLPDRVAALDGLLVLERVLPGEPMHIRQGHGRWLEREVRLLGRALGRWHAATSLSGEATGWVAALCAELPRHVPWILGALGPRPPAFTVEHDRMRALLEPLGGAHPLAAALADAAREWRADAVIHGDVRWDNALCVDGIEGPDVLLVDWEFATVGDPAWDLACALGDATASRFAPGGDGGSAVTAATMDGVAPYARAVADGYLAARPEGGADLDRAGGFLPARILQIALQHAVWDPVSGADTARRLAGVATALAERR